VVLAGNAQTVAPDQLFPVTPKSTGLFHPKIVCRPDFAPQANTEDRQKPVYANNIRA
jgi:hypothetical protein